MRTLFASVSIVSLCWSSLLLGGCETKDCKTEEGEDAVCAESLEAFEGDEVTRSEDYVPGASVTIQGLYGDISVQAGDEGAVSVDFAPFNYRGHSEEEDALREIDENLELDMAADVDGNISITTDRSESKTSGLGSHITVYLPPEFNGVLIVENSGDGVINQGNVSVGYVGEAQVLNVVNHGLENCNILRPEGRDDEAVEPSTLTDTDVRCGADIYVRGVNDNVYVDSREPAFHSDVHVEIASISAAATGGEIKGANTNVQVLFPLAGDYNISASAAGSGARLKELSPGNCEVDSEDGDGAELTCGTGGPIYTLQAQDSNPDDDHNSVVNVFVE